MAWKEKEFEDGMDDTCNDDSNDIPHITHETLQAIHQSLFSQSLDHLFSNPQDVFT